MPPDQRFRIYATVFIIANLIFGVAIMVASTSSQYWPKLAFSASGYLLLLMMSGRIVKNESAKIWMGGRVMGISTVAFFSGVFIGSILARYLISLR